MARPQGNAKPFDNSHVPPAARRAAEEAQRLQEQLTSQGNGEGEPEPQEPPQPTNPEPPKPTDGQGSFSDERPQPQPEPQPTNPEPPKPEEDPNAETWKAKFESEQGRAARARKDVEALTERIEQMSRVMATLQQAPQQNTGAAPVETPRFVTPEMQQEWGDDFMAAVEAKAKELITPLEQRLEEQLKQVGGRVDAVAEKEFNDARNAMITRMNTELPGWVEQNEDQEFVQWLKMPDVYSGRIRKDMLLEAWNVNDASRVAAFFSAFRRETNAVAPQPSSPATAPAAAPQKPSLEQFAAPGVPRSAAPAKGPADIEPISRRDIARYYADLSAGRFRGKEAEAQAYEKAIFAAQAAGKITE